MKTLEQERAAFAWKKVQGQSGDYRTLVKSAPAMIMSNGLMQTLAFLKGKGKQHHGDLLSHLLEWLVQRKIIALNIDNGADFSASMENLYGSSSQRYQQATEEAMAILRWLRQLVDAALKEDARSKQ